MNGCKDATMDFDIIRAWWVREPLYNVAIATGSISGIFVVDVDGPDAEAALRKLELEFGELPTTVEVITGRGRHLYFRISGGRVQNSVGKIALGIDVRGENGFVLVPPSNHPSGRPYAWSVDAGSTIATAPDWLLSRVSASKIRRISSTPPLEWRALMADGVDEGQRDNATTRLCGYFCGAISTHSSLVGILQVWNQARCRPPLPPEDIERIVQSIASKEIARRQGHGG